MALTAMPGIDSLSGEVLKLLTNHRGLLMCALIGTFTNFSGTVAAPVPTTKFEVEEATITSVHRAMLSVITHPLP